MIQYVAQRAGRPNGLATILAAKIAGWARSGITMLEMPPARQTQYGPLSQSLGYDPVRDYDWGTCGTPTRLGTEAEFQALSRECHRRGVLITVDMVDRQYGGEPPYEELTDLGRPNRALFYKGAGLFAAQDDTPFDPELVASDGTLAKYQHSLPRGWMLEQKVLANRAMLAALGLDGWRQDEAKSMWEGALHALFAARTDWVVAEYYSGDMALLWRWWNTFRIPVLDFPGHFAYRDVSNGMSCTRLIGGAFADANPDGACRFVDDMDTQGAYGVMFNKLWFYLHALTMPCKAARIDATDFEVYALGEAILNYAWIGEKLARGGVQYVLDEFDLIAWFRDGDGGKYGSTPGVLCGFSRDPIHTQWRWVRTPFGPHAELHNYAVSGGENRWTNQDGWAYLPFGPNVYGSARNGVAWSLAGQDGPLSRPSLPDRIWG